MNLKANKVLFKIIKEKKAELLEMHDCSVEMCSDTESKDGIYYS